MLKDIATIRDALVGTDLRGGIVKDVADMKSQLATMQCEEREEKTEKKKATKNKAIIMEKYKFAFISLGLTLIGIVVGHLLDIL